MNRRQRPTGEWEILVDTPAGPQWQLESVGRPKQSSHWSAGYSPTGRSADVPSTYRTQQTGKSQSMFGDLFTNALGGSTGDEFGEDVPKGTPTFAGGSPLKGHYANPRPMAPWAGAQAPSGYGMVQPKKKIFEGYKPWSLMGY